MDCRLYSREFMYCYQPLFDLMKGEYGVTLLVSEMDEVIRTAAMVTKSIDTLLTPKAPNNGE